MNKIIEVDNFVKNYGDLKAVRGISFYVEQGKLFSLLGPNGAGKSTTIDTLCTLMDFDGGHVIINGHDLRRETEAIRQNIGVVFQDSVLDSLLTVHENLLIRAGLYTSDKKRIKNMVDGVIEITELRELVNRPYGKLSGGQRRRADIARALLHKPKILFLDEPTTGLDPQTRLTIWDTIRKLQMQTGMTIFLTTHYMEEAAESDYCIVIDHGKIAARGTPAELKTLYATDLLYVTPRNEHRLCEQLATMKIDYTAVGAEYVIKLPDTMAALPILETCKPYITAFKVLQGTMDDAFIGITGRGGRQ